MESRLTPPEYSVDPFDGRFTTSTQKGAIGEAIVSNALMLVSRGRFSPFKPVADDDGLDLLVFDKVTRQCVTLQVKARMAPDAGRAHTVQFDVGLSTFTRADNAMVLYVLLEGAEVRLGWLVPSAELEGVARRTGDKLVITPSANPQSADKYSRYRHHSMDGVALQILNAMRRRAGT